jgi:hypothetical protein
MLYLLRLVMSFYDYGLGFYEIGGFGSLRFFRGNLHWSPGLVGLMGMGFRYMD